MNINQPFEVVIFDGIDAITRHRFSSETRSIAWIVAAYDEHPNATSAVIRLWSFDEGQGCPVLERSATVARWQSHINWKRHN